MAHLIRPPLPTSSQRIRPDGQGDPSIRPQDQEAQRLGMKPNGCPGPNRSRCNTNTHTSHQA
eukprot:7227579-Karenia_brevis.AAC.1